MTKQLEALIAPIRHSPLKVEIAETIQRELAEERERREQFYHDMTPDQKVEFIDGEVVMHSPARNSHLTVTLNISRLLSVYVDLNKLGELRVEKCLCVFPRNDYEPDLVFFGPEKSADLTPETMKFPVPDLAVEVLSPSTEARDRGVKFEDYALHGVAEYWIVDAETRMVEQYLLDGETYKLGLKSDSGHLASRVIDGFRAPIEAFFASDANLAALRDLV